MFQVMRIPQYVTGRAATIADARPLLAYSTAEEANRAVAVLTEFTTHPPGPMQAVAACHFVRSERGDRPIGGLLVIRSNPRSARSR